MTVDQSNEVLPPVDAVDYPEGFGWVLTRYPCHGVKVALREREVSIDHKAGDEGSLGSALSAPSRRASSPALTSLTGSRASAMT